MYISEARFRKIKYYNKNTHFWKQLTDSPLDIQSLIKHVWQHLIRTSVDKILWLQLYFILISQL